MGGGGGGGQRNMAVYYRVACGIYIYTQLVHCAR